ncbi:MAG: type IV secretory system conjugative DNA transfer family protein [Deltaproteobacteria bacterium]|nr:type IV secretory system conjugative DNA transfer family protein [Deltaproteobacteria bacterium]
MINLSDLILPWAVTLSARMDVMGNAREMAAEYRTELVLISVGLVIFLGVFKGWWLDSRVLARNKARHGRPARSRTNELGSGDLARREHILPWITKHDEFDTLLPVKELRGADGVALKEGNMVIPREERNRHLLIIAKTGSGKTTRMILPVLYSDCLNPNRSTIILDSKPEMWDLLAGLTRKHNPQKRILLFNPLDTARSLSWNILGKIESDTDAKLIANTIIMATDNPNSKSDSPFFRNNALQVLNAVMCGLLDDPQEVLSMPRVHELVHSGMQSLCDWLEAHPSAIRNSRTFVELARSGSQNADTIMSELGMRLSAWDLTAIRATTSSSELDLELLINEPTLFIVELRESELEMLRPMANVIVVELLRFLTKRAENLPGQRLPRPVGLVIDEFASALGRLPDIHVKLNTLRSRNVSIVAAIQSIAQIKANYDKDADSVLSGFSTKIFMPALDFQDSEWASKETGTMTVRFNVTSKGRNKRMIDYFSHKNDNLQEQVQQRAVLTPDEIGKPADNACTFFMPNTPVFQGHLVPYYKMAEMNKDFVDGKKMNFQPREAPIEYVEELPAPGPVSTPQQAPGRNQPSATLSPDQLQQQLEQVKAQIGWNSIDSISRQWWQSFEAANAHNVMAVYNLAQELKKRDVSIADFYTVYATTGNQDVTQILDMIDKNMYAELKKILSYSSMSKAGREWWAAFEEANKANFPIIIELAKQLAKREVTIEDFYLTYLHSDLSSIPEILGVMDHLIEQGKMGKAAKANAAISGQSMSSETAGMIMNSGPAEIEEARQMAQEEQAPASPLPEMSKQAKKQAAIKNVHVNSYFAMAEDLLQQGKKKEFDVLITMVKEDPRCSEDDIKELLAMKAYFERQEK